MPSTPVTPEAAIVDQAVEAALDAAAERVARWGRHTCAERTETVETPLERSLRDF